MIGFFLITTKFLSKVNVPKKTNLKLKVSFIKFDSTLQNSFFGQNLKINKCVLTYPLGFWQLYQKLLLLVLYGLPLPSTIMSGYLFNLL